MSRIRKKPQQFVTIANAPAGGSRYTTVRKALDYVQRGVARYVNEGAIEWIEHQELRIYSEQIAAARREAEIEQARGSQFWWNGADLRSSARHIPGENVVYPRVWLPLRLPIQY